MRKNKLGMAHSFLESLYLQIFWKKIYNLKNNKWQQ